MVADDAVLPGSPTDSEAVSQCIICSCICILTLSSLFLPQEIPKYGQGCQSTPVCATPQTDVTVK